MLELPLVAAEPSRRTANVSKPLLALVLLGGLVGAAGAADQPISGKLLKLKSSSSGARLTFVSRDPAVPFPPLGSADDPSAGTPGGMTIDLFTTGPASTTTAGPGVGRPGWATVDGAADGYLYRGTTATPVRKVVLRQEKVLNVRGDDVGLDLSAPLGAVAIRITTGTLRSCALFGAATVRRDEAGDFLARGASASALADCSDATLQNALSTGCTGGDDWPTCGGSCANDGVCAPTPFGSCTCAFPSSPCGGTAPVCNGECGAGEECAVIEDGLPGEGGACVCTPIGVTPCGAPEDATCGGGCASGSHCELLTTTSGSSCSCLDDDAMCGPGGPGACPIADSTCTYQPVSGNWICLPTFCGGTFPTCGGTCGGGKVCVPVESVGGPELCVCATPSLSCGEGVCEGGLTCPSGEVCTIDGGNCSCEPA